MALGISGAANQSNLLCTLNNHHFFDPPTASYRIKKTTVWLQTQTFVVNTNVITCFFCIGKKNSTAASLLLSLLCNKSRGLRVSACIKRAVCFSEAFGYQRGVRLSGLRCFTSTRRRRAQVHLLFFSSLSSSHLCLCVYANTTSVFLHLMLFFPINSKQQASLVESDDRLKISQNVCGLFYTDIS